MMDDGSLFASPPRPRSRIDEEFEGKPWDGLNVELGVVGVNEVDKSNLVDEIAMDCEENMRSLEDGLIYTPHIEFLGEIDERCDFTDTTDVDGAIYPGCSIIPDDEPFTIGREKR